MKLSRPQFVIVSALPLLLLALTAISPLSGQEAKGKAKGRLPPYYSQVVDNKQRTKIYELQAKYKDQIDKLESELKAVNAKMKEEIDALLTKDQKEKLEKIVTEAKAKNAKAKTEDVASEKTDEKPEDK